MEGERSPAVVSLLVIAPSSQKMLLVVVHRLWNQSNRARVISESEKHRIHKQKFLLVVTQGPCSWNWSHMWWSVTVASLMWYSVYQAWSDHIALLNEEKIGQSDLRAIHWLPQLMPLRLLSNDHHMTIIRLFGSIRAQLMFCSYPHVSVPSLSMLITANGVYWCLHIWIQEFAILKQSQSQHSWWSFALHIYETKMSHLALHVSKPALRSRIPYPLINSHCASPSTMVFHLSLPILSSTTFLKTQSHCLLFFCTLITDSIGYRILYSSHYKKLMFART